MFLFTSGTIMSGMSRSSMKLEWFMHAMNGPAGRLLRPFTSRSQSLKS